ncbi:hypothetical protein E2C01_049117 [Portunus trituberculatus]|uniref:Uncharacterized protein n=1 Tax=Portunus trituberculatus TaxID=210409 RepID=A0A5B7GCB4_PORTR|nr:hypothetical protein [Portunus trituberculatus]
MRHRIAKKTCIEKFWKTTTPRGQAIALHCTLLSVTHILEVLKSNTNRIDFCTKEVGTDLIKAATIIVNSFTVLDIFTQVERNSVVAQEVSLLNMALTLLDDANHHNNLARCFIIKYEINHMYAHLCSDKVPMRRFLFGDDVSQSAKKTEET